MRGVTRLVAPCAALLFAAGCAGTSAGSKNSPTAQKYLTPQQQSEQALQAASDAQKRANEQAKKAAEAQQEVQKKQAELQSAQQKARQEQARAEQLQREANQETQQATRQATQSQQQATRALSQATNQVQQGVMTLQGQVAQANGREIVVQRSNGSPMTFRVTSDTDVRIDGRQARATEITPGENALVAYEVSGTQPTARSVQIVTGAPGIRSSGSTQPSSTGPQDTGTSTQPAR